MLEKTIPKNQLLFFRAMQNEAQRIIDGNRKLLDTQEWVTHRASRFPVYKENAIRSLYWFLSINIDRAYSSIRIFDFANARGRAAGQSLFGSGIQTRPSDSAHNLARELDHNLSHDLNDDFAINFSYFPYPDLESKLNRAFDRASKDTFPPASPLRGQKGLDLLEIDLETLNVVQIVSIFRALSEKKRAVAPLRRLHIVLLGWSVRLHYASISYQTPSCPTGYSDMEWINFHQEIRQKAGEILELDLMTGAWNDDDFQAADAYLKANQLFWDCLQNSKSISHNVFEDMILKAPSFRK